MATEGEKNDSLSAETTSETKSSELNDPLQDYGSSSDPPKRVMGWEVCDVIRWLENKNLHKFIFLFQKHKVTGKELIDLNLPFLESYDHITLDDREILLSEIYLLLNPSTIHASEEDLTRLKSPVEKRKFYAAMEVAQVKSATLPRSASNFVYPSHQVRTICSLSRSPAMVKPRHKSESGVGRVKPDKLFDAQLYSKMKQGKLVPKTNTSKPKTVYDCVDTFGSHCVQCLTLTPEQRDLITMVTGSEGHVTISGIPAGLTERLHVGDRVLEINGQLVSPHVTDGNEGHLTTLLNMRTPTSIVILSQHIDENANNCSEEKWRKLHTILVDLRDSESFPPMETSPSILNEPELSAESAEKKMLMKNTQVLQKEVQRLEERVAELQRENEALYVESEDRDAIMHDLEMARDKAIEKMRESRTNGSKKSHMETTGGLEYYNMTLSSLNLEEKSREDAVNSLKEIVMEASKQKWYLDRLISLVIEESPWLLDEVDSELDSLTLTSQSEEFC
ncbi:uncharacterized protein LOC128232920 [Mya arenaria]|uniref:uncharacterized protein LOC128232920 n=1 Tax=Mya arenaria TaxID=6604 RepID=UPI0022E6CDDE|nr:uncharacterized protein LOC128232920 [Mya arenaria]XP_052802683.1 uncharacterized protein LOC128232920 [Mya arenaria]